MNPVFWLLILIVAIALWFMISFVFIPLGEMLLKKWDKTVEILNNEKQKNQEEKEKKKDE